MLLHLSRKHGFPTPLSDKESSLPTGKVFLFFDAKSDLMIGADYGSQILRSPWFQTTWCEIFSFSPSTPCESLPQNDMQGVTSKH
jgi:hypothetical protein